MMVVVVVVVAISSTGSRSRISAESSHGGAHTREATPTDS